MNAEKTCVACLRYHLACAKTVGRRPGLLEKSGTASCVVADLLCGERRRRDLAARALGWEIQAGPSFAKESTWGLHY